MVRDGRVKTSQGWEETAWVLLALAVDAPQNAATAVRSACTVGNPTPMVARLRPPKASARAETLTPRRVPTSLGRINAPNSICRPGPRRSPCFRGVDHRRGIRGNVRDIDVTAVRVMAMPYESLPTEIGEPATVSVTVSINNTAPATGSLNPSYSMATYTLLPFCRPG